VSQLFDRSYRLTVDTFQIEGGVIGTQRVGLDIGFGVECTIKKEPNKAKITVFNPNADTCGTLQKHHKEGTAKREPVGVQLEAGYKDDIGTIFRGDLRTLVIRREGPDLLIEIQATEGGHAYRSAEIKRAWKSNTPVSVVIQACAEAMDIGTGNLDRVINDLKITGVGSSFAHGYAVRGNAFKALDKLIRSTNYQVSIQRGVLQFQERGQPVDRNIFSLSSDTGLVGTPEPIVDATVLGKDGKPSKKHQGGVKFKTLLLHQLRPGVKVNLDAENTKGDFNLTEVTFSGSSFGNEWNCDCTARPV